MVSVLKMLLEKYVHRLQEGAGCESQVTRAFTLVDHCLTLRASVRRDGRPLTALLIWARAV